MTGKIVLHIGKNPSKARPWLASVINWFHTASGPGGRLRSHWNFCGLDHHLCLETVFPGLKLTQNCYLHYNTNLFF